MSVLKDTKSAEIEHFPGVLIWMKLVILPRILVKKPYIQ